MFKPFVEIEMSNDCATGARRVNPLIFLYSAATAADRVRKKLPNDGEKCLLFVRKAATNLRDPLSILWCDW